MNNKDLKMWLRWRKEMGLKPVRQSVINNLMRDNIAMEVAYQPELKIYKVKTYLWGLIKIYKPLNIK